MDGNQESSQTTTSQLNQESETESEITVTTGKGLLTSYKGTLPIEMKSDCMLSQPIDAKRAIILSQNQFLRANCLNDRNQE